MAIRNIRIDGDPILRKRSKEVKNITPRILQLLEDMEETMMDDEGIGLAAVQVGILKRIIVVAIGNLRFKMINPQVTKRSLEEQLDIEGCLSIPDFHGTVYRPEEISVKYLDPQGQEKEIQAKGLLARCILHEIDHLDGVLFKDRVDKVINLANPTEDMLDYLKEHHLYSDDNEEVDQKEETKERIEINEHEKEIKEEK